MRKNRIILCLLIIVISISILIAFAGCSKKEQASTVKLVNKNSTPETIKLYDYLLTTYKHGIITGQQESTWMEGGADYEVNYIHEVTGKYPALRGFDFINDDFDGCVERAMAWAERGGIVTICWHCSSALDATTTAREL